MTNTEQAKMTALLGTGKYMADNSGAYTGVQLIIDARAEFDTAFADTTLKAAAAKVDNSGFSEDKATKKIAAIQEAAAICGYAKQDWDTAQPTLAGQLHDAETDYQLADSDCAALLLQVYGVLNTNSALLNPAHVSATELTDFQGLISAYTSEQGSSDAAHEAKPELVAAFKKALAVSMKKRNKLLKAAKKVRKTQVKFYDGLLLVAEIPTITVRHTHIHLTVKNKATGLPLAGVTASFSTSVKTAVSDVDGHIVIDGFRGGNTTATFKKTGFVDLVVVLHIKSGKDNVLEVEMVGG